MDRSTLLVIAAGLLAMVLLSAVLLPQRSQSTVAGEDRPQYAQDDIRAKYQQADRKKARKKQPPAKSQFSSGTSSGAVADPSNDDTADEAVGDTPAEEPEIE